VKFLGEISLGPPGTNEYNRDMWGIVGETSPQKDAAHARSPTQRAKVAELAGALLDLGSSGVTRRGSNPLSSTKSN
jgi:hypothetical protein